MLRAAIRASQAHGDHVIFKVMVAMPTSPARKGVHRNRLVTLKAVCGPADDGTPCITVMQRDED